MNIFGLKIDEIYETNIISLENEGCGVAKINGIVTFIPKTLVGEKVLVRITELKKNYARGKVVKVIEESKTRVKPICPYYDECGGCDLRHQDKKENLKFKKEKVKTALKKIGKIDVKVEDVIESFKNNNYRNKASFKVENDKIGFYVKDTYQLVDIDNCLLLEKEINNALTVIRTYLKENNNHIKNVVIRCGNALGEVLIDITSSNNKDVKILDYLTYNISNLKTVLFNGKVVYGNGYIKQVCNSLMFNCSSNSFFQVNSMQAEKLYNLALELSKLDKDDIALDLYSGTGTISSIISSCVKKVIAIEINEIAVLDAKENIKINGINNVNFICGDAAKEISKIKENVDVIFIDPPRSGVLRSAIAVIKKINPKKIIYISCNPVTMARDLNYLSDMYKVKKVVPVDMFPNTAHVECVCLLERK